MEKTIKYLENGEYHYATVKDVGDLAKLKTDSKDDLVTAINELFVTGGDAHNKPDGYDKLVDNVADAIQKQQDISEKVDNIQHDSQHNAQLTETEIAQIRQEQAKAYQEYLQAVKELNDAINKTKSDAENLANKTADLQNKIDAKFADVSQDVNNIHRQLDTEAAGLHNDLDNTKKDLESTRTDLLNNVKDNDRVKSEVTELKDKIDRKIWTSNIDPVREQVVKNTTDVSQAKNELKTKADQSNLDLVTNSVEKLNTQVKENAEGLRVTVKRDELGGDVARLLSDKTNLLLGTRSFSGKDNWKNRDKVTIEPGYYKGLKSVAVQVTDGSIYQPYHVKANTVYTFSFFGREDKDNPKASLIIKPLNAQNANVDNGEQTVHITTEWQRFAVTFSLDQECDISIQVVQGAEATDNVLHLAGFKLQYGQNNTPWEPNEADVAENIEHTESQFNVYSDQIAGIVKKQEEMGDTERQLDTRITETAEGLKQTSKDLQDANGKITEFKGQLESTARGLKTEYEKYTNEAVGQISDSSLNLIHNSAFQNKDEDFAQWQNVSAKATLREDSNGLRWVELTQSEMTTDNPQGVTSNYFNVKQGKVTVAVDIKAGTGATLDNESVLFLELYDGDKKRVDFKFVTLTELDLSKKLLEDQETHRGLYRLAIDRTDAKYMTVKAHLMRNGDLYFTNFSARLSSIDDGGYTPNPDDVSQQILKQNTKIEQNAKEVAIKANSVDVTRDIKSAVDEIQVGGTNLANKTNQGIANWMCDPGTGETNLTEININGVRGVRFNNTKKTTNWWVAKYALDLNKYEPNTDYVISFDIRASANVAPGGMLTIAGVDSGHSYFTDGSFGQQLNANQLTHVSLVKHTNENLDKENYESFYLNQYELGQCDWVDFVNLKIEKGNKGTAWSSAPQDTSDEIKSAKDAAIQVASDQINIHVNELSTSFDDKLNKRVNEVKTASEKFTSDGIEQTVRKITDVKNDVSGLGNRLDNLQVGGRNLLTNTDKDISVTSHTTDGWPAWANIDTGFSFEHGKTYTFSAEAKNSTNNITEASIRVFEDSTNTQVGIYAFPADGKRHSVTFTIPNDSHDYHLLLYAGHAGIVPGVDVTTTYHRPKLEFGNVATDWTPAPEDLNKKIDTQTLDSANIDDLKTQGHYFVTSLTGNPLGNGWVYVDVTGNNSDRIRQDVYEDSGSKHMYRRLFGTSWSGWEQGAYLSDVNNAKSEVTASVKNLGDRVTTEVNSITTKLNSGHSNDVELIRKSDFMDGELGNWAGNVSIVTPDSIPEELGKVGTKVLQTNGRDAYETNVWYSVRPGEVFDVDYWIWPSGSFDSNLGLVFVDLNKENWNWIGVVATHGTGWTHYKGTITAPSGAVFARPWFQISKDASDIESSALLAKPSIRRHDQFAEDTIQKINTKLDVANGQIQGKVTETQVNNILNGKGYATQSWAQTMFQMKSDSITLQAVRDNITNEMQNQINDNKNKIDNAQIGERNLAVGTNRGKTGWWLDSGTGTTTMDDGWVNDAMGVTFNNSKKSTSWWVVQYPFDMSRLKPNTYYTISFDLQTDVKINGNATVDLARGDSNGTPFIDNRNFRVMTESGATTHITCTYKTKGSIENNGQGFYLNSKDLGQANWVKIFNLMIVEGTQSTTWVPAPEDDVVTQKGVNLLKSSEDYQNPSDWNIRLTDGSWVNDNWVDSLGHRAYGRKNGAWDGLGQTVYVTPGIYTWSAQIYVDNFADNDFVQVYMGDSLYGGTVQVIGIEVPQLHKSDSDKWVNYSATFFVRNAGNLCVRPELNNAHGEIHVGSQKLEHGSVATPWSPSPMDSDKVITLDSANIDDLKTQGHYFVKNLTGNPIGGWVYVDVMGNGNDRIKQDVYQDNGSHHKYRRWVGSWTEWVDDVNKDNILSQINISPEKILISSDKIEINGDTNINGTLKVPEVRLQGKSGMIGLDGEQGILISSLDTQFQTRVTKFGMDFLTTTNGKKEIMGGITTGANIDNGDNNGISIVLDTEQQLGLPYGGDFFSIGKTSSIKNNNDRTWLKAMDYDASGAIHDGGFMWYEHSTLAGDGRLLKIDGAYDPLLFTATKHQASAQSDKYQPTIRLGYSDNNCSNAGITFLWNQVKPFGDTDISDVGSIWFNGQRFVFGWASHERMFGNQQQPAFMRLDDKGGIMSGIAFTPGSTWDLGSGAWNITASVMNHGG